MSQVFRPKCIPARYVPANRSVLASIIVGLLLTTLSANIAESQGIQTPFKAGERYFFVASNGNLYVKDSRTAKPQRVLAANTFGLLVPSLNGAYITYEVLGPNTASSAASDQKLNTGSYEIRVHDVAKGIDIDTIRNARISRSAWTRNNKGFFYVRQDPSDNRQRVYYHTVGSSSDRDPLVFSRQDQPNWGYDVRVSDDGQYAVMTITHNIDDKTRMYFIDLDNPKKPNIAAPVVKLIDQFGARYTFVDNGGSFFFLQTTRDAPNGNIVLANTNIIRETRWSSVIPQSADTLVFARTAGDDYVIAVGRNNGKLTARVYSPPNPREIQEAMRRRMDSIRRTGGREPRGGTPRDAQDRVPQGPGMARGGEDAPILRLNLTRELPVPKDGTLVDINSFAYDDELFYTVRFADGSVRAYIYNIKNRQNSFFDTTVNGG